MAKTRMVLRPHPAVYLEVGRSSHYHKPLMMQFRPFPSSARASESGLTRRPVTGEGYLRRLEDASKRGEGIEFSLLVPPRQSQAPHTTETGTETASTSTSPASIGETDLTVTATVAQTVTAIEIDKTSGMVSGDGNHLFGRSSKKETWMEEVRVYRIEVGMRRLEGVHAMDRRQSGP